MKKRHITLFTAFAAAAAFASTAQAEIVLSDGHTGDYRIIFVTLDKTLAQATTIGFYNTFVSTQAGLTGSTQTNDLATTWTAIGSTKLTSARVNTGTVGVGDGIHLYTPTTTDDYYQLVATSYDDLWDGSIATGITYGDGSTSGATQWVWTGSNNDGTGRVPADDGSYLGGGTNGDGTDPAIAGSTVSNGASWLNPWSNSDNTTHHMLGMSAVIGDAAPAADPEITSITSLGGGNFELTLKGENNTSYEFRSSATLEFTLGGDLVPLTGGGTDVTTDGSGDATVQMSLAGSANFVRAQ